MAQDSENQKPVSEVAQELAAAHNVKIHFLYQYAIKSFAANMDEASAVAVAQNLLVNLNPASLDPCSKRHTRPTAVFALLRAMVPNRTFSVVSFQRAEAIGSLHLQRF